VPQPAFIDLDAIDLDGVAVSADEVGRLNPQCGHMRQLDHVIWLAEDCSEAVGVKHVRDDEFWVSGHIPGRPLLPGVLMIEAAAQLSSIIYRKKFAETRFLGFTRCDGVAFRGQVRPGDTLYLLARERSFRARRFESEAQAIVSGSLVFEGLITGMVM
jgi:3-hydroxyacyl-[acyl-carrier-protein] dehydratase